MDQKNHRYCVIMCGGIGSRFWPYSRAALPKQFIDFLGTGRTLLQMSYDRISGIIPKQNILIMTNERYAGLVAEQLPEISRDQILLEPARRNTAPCIAWAAWHIAARDPEASMIVTPADHVITRENLFVESVLQGFDFVESHTALLTFGIKPTRPETGYGYIQTGERVSENMNKVKTFTEKPDLELAKVFIASGEFFWNSGIFLWRTSTIIEALRKYVSDLDSVFAAVPSSVYTDPAAERAFISEAYPGCVSISIDYSVMEKADNVYVETVNFGWNDLGTWSALYDNSPADENRNVSQGAGVIAYESEGNIFVTPAGKLVVADGLRDYIVADAGDVLLICPKAREQHIKQMVNDVRMRYDEKYL